MSLFVAPPAHADTGIVVYGSKGTDQRRTDSGHISLLLTDLCASGIDQIKKCGPGEPPGVIVTAYANLASDYAKSIFVVPVLDHFTATDDPALIPVLTSGPALRAAQIEYWRAHLRPYFRPMAQTRYAELRAEMERFDAGRTLRRFLTMEFIGTLMGSHKHQDATEPIALIDPITKELIPEGRWREAIGAEHMRSAVMLTAPSTVEQELRIVQYIRDQQSTTFNVMTDNCSDFVRGALSIVFGEEGLQFRPRALDVADAWITSPLFVATGFVSFAKKSSIPLRVVFLPITAGTRRSRFSVHSLSRGALVPDPTQGKLAFGMKTYFNFLNPLLGLTGFTVDQFSRLANLPHLVHDCGNGDLLTMATDSQACSGKVEVRDRARVFGTSSCWKGKQEAFQKLASQAAEHGLYSRQEESLTLKRNRPFLLARLYEHSAEPTNAQPAASAASCFAPGCTSILAPTGNLSSSQPALDGPAVPGRPQIRLMAESADTIPRQTAFKLMASVVNYDLSSEPTERRNVQAFDKDWRLFLDVAEKNQLSTDGLADAREPLEACSCHSIDTGAEHSDALQDALGFFGRITRGGRELVTGPSR